MKCKPQFKQINNKKNTKKKPLEVTRKMNNKKNTS